MGEESELERLIKQRQKQAEDREIGRKAYAVARYLGKGYETKDGEDENRDYTYEKHPLKIHDTWSQGRDSGGDFVAGGSTKVHYEGELVFNGRHCYVPGRWEVLLDALYRKAVRLWDADVKKQEAKAIETKRIEENEKRKQWGLPLI